MDRLTTELGEALREFETTICNAYTTRELPREIAAREHKRKAQEAAFQKEAPLNTTSQPLKNNGLKEDLQPQIKSLNLQTYKHHALGDYVETIRRYGTTDSYNTETVCTFLSSSSLFLIFINGVG